MKVKIKGVFLALVAFFLLVMVALLPMLAIFGSQLLLIWLIGGKVALFTPFIFFGNVLNLFLNPWPDQLEKHLKKLKKPHYQQVLFPLLLDAFVSMIFFKLLDVYYYQFQLSNFLLLLLSLVGTFVAFVLELLLNQVNKDTKTKKLTD